MKKMTELEEKGNRVDVGHDEHDVFGEYIDVKIYECPKGHIFHKKPYDNIHLPLEHKVGVKKLVSQTGKIGSFRAHANNRATMIKQQIQQQRDLEQQMKQHNVTVRVAANEGRRKLRKYAHYEMGIIKKNSKLKINEIKDKIKEKNKNLQEKYKEYNDYLKSIKR